MVSEPSHQRKHSKALTSAHHSRNTSFALTSANHSRNASKVLLTSANHSRQPSSYALTDQVLGNFIDSSRNSKLTSVQTVPRTRKVTSVKAVDSASQTKRKNATYEPSRRQQS